MPKGKADRDITAKRGKERTSELKLEYPPVIERFNVATEVRTGIVDNSFIATSV
jgi:hypothetical protein